MVSDIACPVDSSENIRLTDKRGKLNLFSENAPSLVTKSNQMIDNSHFVCYTSIK